MKRIHTFCRICPALCGLTVTVDGERVERVEGDREHPISGGYSCPKGRQLGAVHHHPRRLDHPLARRGDQLERVSWRESLDEVERGLRAILEESGPQAVGWFPATAFAYDANGRGLAAAFFKTLGTPQLYSPITLDAPNKLLCSALICGRGGPLVDWDEVRLLVVVGSNPPASHGHGSPAANPVKRLREVRRRGGRLVVIDPRRTKSAALADLHIAPRPATDDFLLAGVVREILHKGMDEDYVRDHVDGLDTVRAAVEPFALDRVAEICDVPRESLETLVDWIREAGRCAVTTGTGISMGPAANATEALTWSLNAITGSLDRKGGLWFHPGVLKPNEERPAQPRAPWRKGPDSRPELRGIGGEMPAVALADEIEAGHIRALFVLGGNPALICPDSERLRAAFRKLELLVVSDIFPTETVQLATHVWPCTDQLERADLPSFFDQSYPLPFTQYAPQVVEPLGERRGMGWPFFQLSRRLGIPVLGKPELDAQLGDDPDANTLLALAAKRSRIPFSEIAAAPHGVIDRQVPRYGWATPLLAEGRFHLGHGLLFASLERDPRPDGERLHLISRRILATMNTTLSEPDLRQEEPDLLIHPRDARARGLRTGDTARVESPHGALEAEVRVTDEIRPGAVSIPHGFVTPNVNLLTSSHRDVDPHTGMPRLTGIEVTVAPARGASRPGDPGEGAAV